MDDFQNKAFKNGKNVQNVNVLYLWDITISYKKEISEKLGINVLVVLHRISD